MPNTLSLCLPLCVCTSYIFRKCSRPIYLLIHVTFLHPSTNHQMQRFKISEDICFRISTQLETGLYCHVVGFHVLLSWVNLTGVLTKGLRSIYLAHTIQSYYSIWLSNKKVPRFPILVADQALHLVKFSWRDLAILLFITCTFYSHGEFQNGRAPVLQNTVLMEKGLLSGGICLG